MWREEFNKDEFVVVHWEDEETNERKAPPSPKYTVDGDVPLQVHKLSMIDVAAEFD
jgi:hypothetical protein